jgi:hypothetical protein
MSKSFAITFTTDSAALARLEQVFGPEITAQGVASSQDATWNVCVRVDATDDFEALEKFHAAADPVGPGCAEITVRPAPV